MFLSEARKSRQRVERSMRRCEILPDSSEVKILAPCGGKKNIYIYLILKRKPQRQSGRTNPQCGVCQCVCFRVYSPDVADTLCSKEKAPQEQVDPDPGQITGGKRARTGAVRSLACL